VHFLVIVQTNKRCTVHLLKIKLINEIIYLYVNKDNCEVCLRGLLYLYKTVPSTRAVSYQDYL